MRNQQQNINTNPVNEQPKNTIGKAILNSSDFKIEDHMDDNNKKALKVMKTQGMEAAIEHMFKHPETGKPMTYGEMRYYYG
jgi:hypothetical protein